MQSELVRTEWLRSWGTLGHYWGYTQLPQQNTPAMSLSDLKIQAAKPKDKFYRIYDTYGLYVQITVSGGKLWRMKYRFDGKEKTLSIGKYPAITLKAARTLREEARVALAQGKDPSAIKQEIKTGRHTSAQNSFERVANEWCTRKSPTWSPFTIKKVRLQLNNDVLPWLGSLPVASISPLKVLETVRRIENRGAVYSSHRVLQLLGQIFRYAIATGKATSDPCYALSGALASTRTTHRPSITDPEEVGQFLLMLDGFTGSFVVQSALNLAPLVFCRPSELRNALWTDINLDEAEWRYYVKKVHADHLVPLSKQAIKILQDLHPLTGDGTKVFPGRSRDRSMSDAAINAALRRLGIDTKTTLTGHGFRAMARTILHERLRYEAAVIEHQLSHRVADALGEAYNRTKFIDVRKEMMQAWADYLDELKANAKTKAKANSF